MGMPNRSTGRARSEAVESAAGRLLGEAKCRNWLNGYTNVATEEVAKARRARTLIAQEKEPDIGMGLKDTQAEVDRYPPTGRERSGKLAENRRGVVD